MKKRRANPYLTATAIIATTAIAVLSFLLFNTRQSEKYYRLQATNSNRHSFTELVAAVGELDSAMQKCVLSGTESMISRNLTEVYGASKAAKQALSDLPLHEGSFEQTSGFITQAGDYALALSKKTAAGEQLADEDRQNLKKLAETAGVLSGNLTGILGDVNGGGLMIEDMRELEKRASKAGDEATEGTFNSRVKASETEFPEMPTLIYDGPFSSHISAQKPKMTEGQDEVSEEDAKSRAEELFGITGLTLDGERGGNLPVYMFSAASDNGASNIEVSKAGGYIVNLYTSHTPATATISAEDAIEKAKEFVAEKIDDPLAISYHMVQDNTVSVNFAYEQDGVICYPDLIIVQVSQETGDISGFEAQGYVMHHHKRELPQQPKISEEQAREKVSKELKILAHALAVIPTSGENEVFCHEFKCENAEGAHNLVYINAETGNEEQILLLIENENGTLAM